MAEPDLSRLRIDVAKEVERLPVVERVQVFAVDRNRRENRAAHPGSRSRQETRPEGPPAAERRSDLPVEELGSVRLVGAGRRGIPFDAKSPGSPLRLGRRLRRDRVLSPCRGVV